MQTNFAGNHATVSPDGQPQHFGHDTLITDIELAEMLGCARSTIWKWVAGGIIPKPLKIGGLSRWRQSEGYDIINRADADREAA